jgi:thioredoxin 1
MWGPNMIEVNVANWTKEVKESKIPVLDCSAAWCGPCKMMIPVLKKIEQDFSEKVKFVSLDVDQRTDDEWAKGGSDLARELRITSIPCFIFFKDGVEKDRVVGYSGEFGLGRWIDILLAG